MLSFAEYPSRRTKRYSPISDFTSSMSSDPEFAAIRTREELDQFLGRRAIQPNGRIFAHAVWKSYVAAKKREEAKSAAKTK